MNSIFPELYESWESKIALASQPCFNEDEDVVNKIHESLGTQGEDFLSSRRGLVTM